MIVPASTRSAPGPTPQLLEVQHDRMVRPQQVGEDLVARARRARRRAAILEKRPQPLADRRREHAFQILERGPCRFRSSVYKLRNAINSGSRGSTVDSSVKTCARLWPARSRTNSSTNDTSSFTSSSSSRRRLSHTGRPTAASRITTAKMRSRSIGDARILVEQRGERTCRTGTGPRTAGRPGRASGRRRRAATRTPRRRAPGAAGWRSPDSGRSARR